MTEHSKEISATIICESMFRRTAVDIVAVPANDLTGCEGVICEFL